MILSDCLADIDRKADLPPNISNFLLLMRDVDLVTFCMKTAITKCLNVWRFLFSEQVEQYYSEWLHKNVSEEVLALLMSLVAIGSRYTDRFSPSCADEIALLRYAKNILRKTPAPLLSAVHLKATYVNVWLPKFDDLAKSLVIWLLSFCGPQR